MRNYSFTTKVLGILTVIFLIPAFVLCILGVLEIVPTVVMGIGVGLYTAVTICYVTILILSIIEISKM